MSGEVWRFVDKIQFTKRLDCAIFPPLSVQSDQCIGIRYRSCLPLSGQHTMPMKQLQSIEIARPIHDVFNYTTTMVAEWSSIVVEEEMLQSINDGGVGTTFRIVTEERGQLMEFESEVTAHDVPHHSGIVMTGLYFDIHANYVFEEVGNGTRLTQNSEVFAKTWLMKIMFTLMGPFMKKSGCNALNKELQSLKDHLEHPENFNKASE